MYAAAGDNMKYFLSLDHFVRYKNGFETVVKLMGSLKMYV